MDSYGTLSWIQASHAPVRVTRPPPTPASAKPPTPPPSPEKPTSPPIPRGMFYDRVRNVSARIIDPIRVEALSVDPCDQSCAREPECKMFSLETDPKTGMKTCRLGGKESKFEVEDSDGTSVLYYDRALVPKRYSFAMVTKNHIHFLRNLQGLHSFGAATDQCRVDVGGDVVMDNQGQDWHERIARHMGIEDSWLGADDIDEDGIYTWVDGSIMETASLYWCDGQPDFHFWKGETERCPELVINAVRPGFDGGTYRLRSKLKPREPYPCWNDVTCDSVRGVLCEVRIP
ncbi:unnamed protein product [Darwinula stevensoni]|uniref:C-type lectin domain-containing protein n=1 Tax=Darwinula stevensoni TaxID=69355 RepID=A0A7R9AHQ8_9CRUS|nr:unnamed protein product [Darwinula stevensoni]CAG0905688.1 unnamed protein product [Darwinula stevensoni]